MNIENNLEKTSLTGITGVLIIVTLGVFISLDDYIKIKREEQMNLKKEKMEHLSFKEEDLNQNRISEKFYLINGDTSYVLSDGKPPLEFFTSKYVK